MMKEISKKSISSAMRFSSASFLVVNSESLNVTDALPELYIPEAHEETMVQLVQNKQYRVFVPELAYSGIMIPEAPKVETMAPEPSEPLLEPEPEHLPFGKVSDEGEDSIWKVLRDCETGDGIVGSPFYVEWTYSGPGYYDGAYQFDPNTWVSLTSTSGYDFAWQAPPSVQTAATIELANRSGIDQWPACAQQMRAKGYIG